MYGSIICGSSKSGAWADFAELFLLGIIFVMILRKELSRGNEMSTVSILTALVRGGMSPIGACAMGGNMMAESGMKSIIVQRGMTKLSDEEYTTAADSGAIDFASDGVGYGLCQWTYKTRKTKLIRLAMIAGLSVGDESLQTDFCLRELKTDFPALWLYLQTADDLREAAAKICREYERPAVNNIEVRYKYAQQMYKDYGAILETMQNAECGMRNEAEAAAYSMATVSTGEHTPEAAYLMAQLKKLGYDVLWLGLDVCLRDFQQKRGLTVDGICGEKTWKELLK